MCGKILIYLEKMATSQPPPLARQQFFEKILILSHRSLRLGPIRRCSFVVFFKTQHVPGSTLCSARIRNGVNGAQPSLSMAETVCGGVQPTQTKEREIWVGRSPPHRPF
jgi:hypothetical protein